MTVGTLILLSLQTSISMQEEDEFRDVLRQLLKVFHGTDLIIDKILLFKNI